MPYIESSETSLEGDTDFKPLNNQLLKYANYRQGATRRIAASQLTPSWLKNNGSFRPVLVSAPEGDNAAPLISLPASGLTPDSLAALLGPTFEVQTLDVPSQQQGPTWTLHQWSLYWKKRTSRGAAVAPTNPHGDPSAAAAVDGTNAISPAAAEDEVDSRAVIRLKPTNEPLQGINPDYIYRLLALPELNIDGTPLAKFITPPEAVQAVDLRNNLDNAEDASQSTISVSMYPSKSFVNSTIAPGGASLWVHLVSGAATLAVSPPTPKNLATYAAWSSTSKYKAVFLPGKCEGTARADLTAGEVLILPPGWSYTMSVTNSATVVSGTFLRADSLAVHLEALRIENFMGLLPNKCYPEMKKLMWHAAARYAAALGVCVVRKIENLEEKVAQRAAEMQREDSAAAEKNAAAAAKAKAKAQAQISPFGGRRAASGHGISRPGSAAGISGDERPQRRTQQRKKKRRRRSPTDSFIESDSEDERKRGYFGGHDEYDEDDEKDWVPEARGPRGGAGIAGNDDFLEEDSFGDYEIPEEDMDFLDEEFGDEDDSEGFGGKRKRKSARASKRARKEEPPSNPPTRVSLRYTKGQLPAKLAAALHGEGAEGGYADAGEGAAPAPPAATPASAQPIKLKIKLPGAAGTGPSALKPTPLQSQPKASPIKLTFKNPAAAEVIPQVDGAADIDFLFALNDDLEEGEEQGLVALLWTLRSWLRVSPSAAATVPISKPWEVLARIELSLKALELSTEAPLCTNFSAIAVNTLEQKPGVELQEPLKLDSGANGLLQSGRSLSDALVFSASRGDLDGEGGEDSSQEDRSGDNAAMIDQKPGSASLRMAAAKNAAAAAAAAAGGAPKAPGGARTAVSGPRAAPAALQRPNTAGSGAAAAKPAAAKPKSVQKLSTKARIKKKLGL